MPTSLLSRFDIFFIIQDRPDEEKDKLLADKIIESHRVGEILIPGETHGETDSTDTRGLEGPISPRMLKLYISYAKKLRPVLSLQAQNMIKEYYTGLRKRYHLQDDEDKTMPITPRQLESIIRLAEADAKMYMSNTVDAKHADHAIDMMNMFLGITLGGDIDLAFTGMNAEQRRRDRDPTTLFVGIVNDGGPNGMDEQEVYDRMKEGGITRYNTDKYLKKLREEGRLLDCKGKS